MVIASHFLGIRRTMLGLFCVLTVVGIVLAPTASDAAPRRPRTPLTTTTTVAQSSTVNDSAAADPPASGQAQQPIFDFGNFFSGFTFPPFVQNLLQQVFTAIQSLLGRSFCNLFGGLFCSS
jgi:hypothetical protein